MDFDRARPHDLGRKFRLTADVEDAVAPIPGPRVVVEAILLLRRCHRLDIAGGAMRFGRYLERPHARSGARRGAKDYPGFVLIRRDHGRFRGYARRQVFRGDVNVALDPFALRQNDVDRGREPRAHRDIIRTGDAFQTRMRRMGLDEEHAGRPALPRRIVNFERIGLPRIELRRHPPIRCQTGDRAAGLIEQGRPQIDRRAEAPGIRLEFERAGSPNAECGRDSGLQDPTRESGRQRGWRDSGGGCGIRHHRVGTRIEPVRPVGSARLKDARLPGHW